MFCPECGSKNSDDARFCANCGTVLQKKAEIPDIESPHKQKMKIQLSKPVKIILAETAVLLVTLVACLIVYQHTLSPASVAEKYVIAHQKADWNELYDTISLEGEKNDFLSKRAFVTAQSMSGIEQTTGVYVERTTTLSKGLKNCEVRVRFRANKSSSNETVSLVRQGLFWKVEDASYLTKNVTISVPKDASLTIDKIALTGLVKPESGDTYDTYRIPSVFGMTHYVEVSGEGMQPTKNVLVLDNTPENVLGTIVLPDYDEDTMKKVAAKALDDYRTLLAAAASNKKSEDIALLKEMSAADQEYSIANYESLRDDTMEHGNTYATLKSFRLTDLEETIGTSEIQDEDSKDQIILEVQIQGNCSKEYTRGTDYTHNYDWLCTSRFSYVYQGDEWILYSVELNSY